MTQSLTEVRRVVLPRSVAARTHAHLRAVGARGLEGMALWIGRPVGQLFRVEEALVPRQDGVRTEHGLMVSVPGPELHRINLHLYRSGMRLLAQVHSHPTHAYHSAMDDEYAIATALGSFSVVVPQFARDPFSIANFATYRLTARPWWKPGSRPEWIEVAPPRAAAIFTLGDD